MATRTTSCHVNSTTQTHRTRPSLSTPIGSAQKVCWPQKFRDWHSTLQDSTPTSRPRSSTPRTQSWQQGVLPQAHRSQSRNSILQSRSPIRQEPADETSDVEVEIEDDPEPVDAPGSAAEGALSAPSAEAAPEIAASGAPQEFAIAGDSPEAELPPYHDEAEDLPDFEADETEPAVAESDRASEAVGQEAPESEHPLSHCPIS